MNSTMFISKYEAQIYALLRIIAGFLFLWHGSQILFGFPPSGHETHSTVIFIGGFIEFVGGLLIMIGLWTPWAGLICSGEMAFAYWAYHGTHAILPVINGGELSMIYCFLFLFISARGSGLFSIDFFLEKRRHK